MNSVIGIVTVTYNSEKVIEGFLQSILIQDYSNYFLYIIDNASRDKTLSLLSKYKDNRIKLFVNMENLGIASGNNIGISAAMKDGCEKILLINNDTEFEINLISKLLNVQSSVKCRLVVPKILYFSEPDVIWYAGGFLSKYRGYTPSHRGIGEKDIGQYSNIEVITYAPTCCVLLDTQVIRDVGLMDENYFVYFDDVDFMYRILKNGSHKLVYLDDVSFFHKVGSLTRSSEKNKNKNVFSNFYIEYRTKNLVYFLKNQKTISSTFFIFYHYFRMNAHFLLTSKYKHDLKTFFLIQKSFYNGLIKK
ncbi:MAG: glycosyltransferase family 2 protein [Firmicutes bacterium]|nr:glycosyltransferase family 2 protein [Bacillota bacterium]